MRPSAVARTVAAGWIDAGAGVVSAVLMVATAVARPSSVWVSTAIVTAVLAAGVVVGSVWWWPRSFGHRVGVIAVGGARTPLGPVSPADHDPAGTLLGRPVVARCVAMVLAVGVCVAAGSLVAVVGAEFTNRRSASDTAASARADGGIAVCRVLTRGTGASRSVSDATAAGDLADRLRAGTELDAGLPGATSCVPVHTGLVGGGTDDADIVASVRLTIGGGAALDRDLTAHLVRVDDRWAVTSVGVV